MVHCHIAILHIPYAGAVAVIPFYMEGALCSCPVRKDSIHVTDEHDIIMFRRMVGDEQHLASAFSHHDLLHLPAQLGVPA